MIANTRCVARVLSVLLLATLAGCAGVSTRGTEQPEILSPPSPRSASRPALIGATVDRPVGVELSVEVDDEGIPDITSLRLSGTGAEANRGVITDWLKSTVFEPARRNGTPNRGTFRMSADATVVVSR